MSVTLPGTGTAVETADQLGTGKRQVVALGSQDGSNTDPLAALATQATLAAVLTALGVNHTDEQQLHTDIATTLLAKNEAIRVLLAGTLTAAVASIAAGETHLGEVGGNTAVAGGSFTRQANTTAYVLGQHVAPSPAAAIACAVARKNAGTGVITGVRLSKSGNVLTNASFRVHLFKTAPATLPNDAAAFAGGVSGITAVALGYVDITMDQQYQDGAKGFAAIQAKAFDTAAGSQNIYALIEARAGYTPVSAEVFTVALEVLRD